MERYINPRKIDFKTHAIPGADGEIYLAYSDVRKAIAQTPSENVVEVVRCENCKHSEMVVDIIGDPHLFCKTHGNAPVGFDDFCSYGERKEQT